MKISIIDPVGLKAGMNCYDLGLLDALRRKGADVYAFSNFNDTNYPEIDQRSWFLFEKKGTVRNVINFLMAHLKALTLFRKRKGEWILLHVFSSTAKDYLSFRIVKLFGKKVIAIVHDVESLSNEDRGFYKQRIYNMSDVLVVHNETSLKAILADLNETNRKKIKVIPHGNYVDFIAPEMQPECGSINIKFDKQDIYLLFFGQIKPVKGLDVLLRALALLPGHYKLIIAGRPHRDDFSRYEQLIAELGIGARVIRIIRFITDEERDYLFKKSNALVLPYRKIFQSGVLLMAMSYGLPVVASDLPANIEVIKDGYNGILFEDGNPESLALNIRQTLTGGDIELLKERTLFSVKENHSWEKIAGQYLELMQ